MAARAPAGGVQLRQYFWGARAGSMASSTVAVDQNTTINHRHGSDGSVWQSVLGERERGMCSNHFFQNSKIFISDQTHTAPSPTSPSTWATTAGAYHGVGACGAGPVRRKQAEVDAGALVSSRRRRVCGSWLSAPGPGLESAGEASAPSSWLSAPGPGLESAGESSRRRRRACGCQRRGPGLSLRRGVSAELNTRLSALGQAPASSLPGRAAQHTTIKK